MDIDKKRKKEIKIISNMIDLYCKKNQKSKEDLSDYEELKNYAIKKINSCPFMETKTFCSNCNVHCYKPDMQKKICEVMRFSGPRMIFYHPIMTIHHIISSKKRKK